MKNKCINQQDIKQANASDVFNIIRKNGALTRSQLQDTTNLSWGAISNIVARLSEDKYIVETKADRGSGAGRIPSYLEVNSFDHFIIGLDINASGFKAVLMNLKNEVVNRYFKEPSYVDKASMLAELFEFVGDVLSGAKGYNILCAGVAMQGLVDSQNGISIQGPMLEDWEEVPLARLLEKKIKIPVYLEHDPDCSLYAFSIKSKLTDALLIRIDKGIGMSVMQNGEIYKRIGMFELGHIVVVPNGEKCVCGKRGCLQAYASQAGLSAGSGLPFETLVENARKGEEKAVELFKNMAEHLAREISNISHLLCINNIVLCGDMWNYRDVFAPEFTKKLADYGAGDLNLIIAETEHAARGAAFIAIERFLEKFQF